MDRRIEALRRVATVTGGYKRHSLVIVVRGCASHLLPLGQHYEGAPDETRTRNGK